MRWAHEIRARLVSLLRRSREEDEMREELETHVQMETEKNLRLGMGPAEARRRALLSLGGMDQVGEGVRDARGTRLLDDIGADLRYAARRLRRSPALTVGVVATFALGIGANATAFSMVDRLLLRAPDHVARPDEVRQVGVDRFVRFLGRNTVTETFAYADYQDFAASRSFAQTAAFAPRDLLLGRGEDAREVQGALVTAGFFPLLEVRPALGRFFTADEDRPGAAGTAVLAHGLWQSEYGGDPGVIGRTLDFGRGPYTIVGVAPEGFTGANLSRSDVWLPLRTAGAALAGPELLESRDWYWLRIVARLAPGASEAQAAAEASVLHLAGNREAVEQGDYDGKARVVLSPLIAGLSPNAAPEIGVAKWLAGVSLVVLLVACANVANLLLARSLRARRETAVRLALGGGRGRIVRQALVEVGILALLGGAAAMALTHWGGGLVREILLPDVAWGSSLGTGRVAVFVAGAAVASALLAGLFPAWQGSRADVLPALKAGARGASTRRSRMREGLLVLQAALSVLLLVGAGLFVRSVQRVDATDLGIDPAGVQIVRPVLDPGAAPGERALVMERAAERLAAVPAVEAVAPTEGIPFYSSYAYRLRLPGRDSLPTAPTGGPYFHAVGPEYFRVLGLRILRGRALGAGDGAGAERVVVVNASMASAFWPGEDALGQCIRIRDEDAPCTTVVGIVEDARRDALREDETHQYYVPHAQKVGDREPEALLVRPAPGADVTAAIQREVLASGPAVRHASIVSLEEMIAPHARSWRLGAAMFTLFGALALVVASVGLYGVLAFAVAERAGELGVRAALGATPGRLVRMVAAQGLRLVGGGIVLGLALAFALAPRLEPMLYETAPHDPLVYGAVAAALAAVALLASGIPSWHAARADPQAALRAE